MTILYSSKTPRAVESSMRAFTGDDCFLVKRRKTGLTGKGIQGNCHFNVQGWVDRIGGRRVPGWLLYRDKTAINKGMWVWSFHSVWETPEGEIVDVTQDKVYDGSDYTTVWFDKHRDIDIIKGESFNNILIITDRSTAYGLGRKLGYQVEPDKLHWTTSKLQLVVPLDAHSGVYKWIDDTYPENIQSLQQDYHCTVKDGALIPTDDGPKMLNTKILLDYSVSS